MFRPCLSGNTMTGGKNMNITQNKNDSTLSIALEGRLDTNTAPDLEKVLKDSLEGVTELIIDFEKLEYISSAGLRVILSTQKQMNKQGEMRLTGVCDDILEVFEITGFTDILNIE